jgi:hypothetical protein
MPSRQLPPDAQAFGFDTNADALSVEPALLDAPDGGGEIARVAVGDPTLRRRRALHGRQGNANEQTWLWQTDRLARTSPKPWRAASPRVTTSCRWRIHPKVARAEPTRTSSVV